MLNLKTLGCCILVCLLGNVGSSFAISLFCPTPDPDPIALQLLVDMWDKNTDNREGSEALFERQISPGEQVLFAYTLNRMKHNRYRDARTPARQLTAAFPQNLDGWILRIWLDTVTNQYDQGLIGMRLMKREMDKLPNLDDTEKEKYLTRLARIVGYLQGPVANRTDQATLNSTITKIAEGLTAKQLKLFNDQRTATLNEFDQYVKDDGDLKVREKEKAAAQSVAETQAIATQNQTLDARLQQIQPEKQRLQLELEQKESTIESQLGPLRQELVSVVNLIQEIEISLQIAYQDRNLEQVLLLREPDLNLRALISRRINRINLTISAIESDLFAARARGNTLDAQVRQLSGELARSNQTFTRSIDQLTSEENQANRQKRKNASRLVKIAKGSGSTTAKIRNAEIEIESLRTYDPFPIELARQEYLDTIRATK